MTPTPGRPERIISGGQTGVDRGALDAALELGLDAGGFCPRGRRAEDGRIPDRYPLEELDSSDYRDRTRRNVEVSDATLILCRGPLSGGTALTRRIAEDLGRPLLIVDLSTPPDPDSVRRWIHEQGIRTLNVAGPRESGSPGIQDAAHRFLLEVFLTPPSGRHSA